MLSPIMFENGALRMLDQTRLPQEEVWIQPSRVEEVAQAIRTLAIRGAPAIGIAAAFGVVLGAMHPGEGEPAAAAARRAMTDLGATRPTAVNLFWALERMRRRMEACGTAEDGVLVRELLAEAQTIRSEDIESCRAIGKHGAALLPDPCVVITHCNAGALATGGYGTALGVIRAAVEAGKKVQVFADETRPLLQGARLTSWELMRDGIDVTLLCDGMAGRLMQVRRVDACIVGADRIALNGDVANKIGTYPLAVMAQRHGIPFYVAAPVSTLDAATASGRDIPVEERDPSEITHPGGRQIAPDGVATFSPAFDVTPVELVQALITERGVATRPGIGERIREWTRSHAS